jgi:hypothetical protein
MPASLSTRALTFKNVCVCVLARIQPYLPAKLLVGGRERLASGINARLRIYRYQPDGEQTFRPHTDDSFPMSACVNDR